MKTQTRVWRRLGLGVGMAGALAGAGLAGCSDEADEGGDGGEADTALAPGEAGEAGEGGEAGERGESGGDVGALPIEQRLAFMSGHVEAGLALYRAGQSEAAAPHLLHPVSETHAAERAGLDELGFEPQVFETVSQALEEGRPADMIEPQLQAAKENLMTMRERAGGDPAELIRFLMDIAVEEYTIAVTDGAVSDAGEYHDAWGFAVTARELARDMNHPRAARVREALDTMIGLWPDGAPVVNDDPAPVGEVSALASRVKLALPQ